MHSPHLSYLADPWLYTDDDVDCQHTGMGCISSHVFCSGNTAPCLTVTGHSLDDAPLLSCTLSRIAGHCCHAHYHGLLATDVLAGAAYKSVGELKHGLTERVQGSVHGCFAQLIECDPQPCHSGQLAFLPCDMLLAEPACAQLCARSTTIPHSRHG